MLENHAEADNCFWVIFFNCKSVLPIPVLNEPWIVWKLWFPMTTAQKMKFSIKDFFSKCDQIRRKLQISSYLLKKSLMETSFCVQLSVIFMGSFSSHCFFRLSWNLLAHLLKLDEFCWIKFLCSNVKFCKISLWLVCALEILSPSTELSLYLFLYPNKSHLNPFRMFA